MPISYLDTHEASILLGINLEEVQELCRIGYLPGAFKQPERGTWLIPSEAVTNLLMTHYGDVGSKPQETTGDRFQVGNISGSNVAMGRNAKVDVTKGISEDELGSLFDLVYKRIQSRPEDPNVDKEEINNTVQSIETEASKGEKANPNKIERWLKILAIMAPDILDVTVAALISPGAALAEVIRKVAAKAKQQAESTENS